ncbi:twin-arginine translocation signal domain-containing protein [Caballeronia sp. M23-90]
MIDRRHFLKTSAAEAALAASGD